VGRFRRPPAGRTARFVSKPVSGSEDGSLVGTNGQSRYRKLCTIEESNLSQRRLLDWFLASRKYSRSPSGRLRFDVCSELAQRRHLEATAGVAVLPPGGPSMDRGRVGGRCRRPLVSEVAIGSKGLLGSPSPDTGSGSDSSLWKTSNRIHRWDLASARSTGIGRSQGRTGTRGAISFSTDSSSRWCPSVFSNSLVRTR